MRWGDSVPTCPHLPPAPAWSAFCAAAEGHRAVGAVLRDAFYSPRPASRGLPSSPETAAPTAQHGPPGKSTVAVINIGMWLGMRTAQGQVLLLQMSSVTVKKSRAACVPSCPLPACCFVCVFFFLAQNPPDVPRSSFSEAQEAGFS